MSLPQVKRFTFSSENNLLNANGSTAKIIEQGAGGGTYNLTKIDSAEKNFAGIQANSGGLIDLSNAKKITYTSKVRNTGDAAQIAVLATGNSSIKLSDLTLNHENTTRDPTSTSMKGPTAIQAQSNSQINIAKLDLTTNENGLTATDTGSRIDVGGGLITANGDLAQAVRARNGAEVNLTNTNIEMSGNGAKAFDIDGNGSRVTMVGGKINLSGSRTTALELEGFNSSLSLTGVTIIASGPLASGASYVFSDGLRIHDYTSGVEAGNQITLTDTTIDVTGKALASYADVETVDVVGGRLTGRQYAIYASYTINNGSLQQSHLTVNTNDTILEDRVAANTDTNAGTVLDFNMVGSDVTKSVLTGDIINARNVSASASTFNITGNSDVVNLTNSSSDFRFVNDGVFKTLIVTNYTGLGAANVYSNTRLNGDDVTGTNTDKIVVRDGGRMSGDTTFHINNVGGAGVANTPDGILFADAQGSATIDKTNFKLAGGSVTAGAYAYVARQGQYSNLAGNSQDLFLTSSIPSYSTVDANGFVVDGVPPAEENGSNGNVPSAEENNSSGNTSNGGGIPPAALTISYSADFVTYNAIADVVSLSASTLLGTYHERMGAQNTALVR